MNKSIALVLLLSISSLHGTQEPKPNYVYIKRVAGLLAITLIFTKATPKEYSKQLLKIINDLGPVLTVSVLYPFLIKDANDDKKSKL